MKKPPYPSTRGGRVPPRGPAPGGRSAVGIRRAPAGSGGGGPGFGSRQDAADEGGYREFAASELYCPKCGEAMPVREKQLLYLPNGGVSDYRCAKCGTVLGTRRT